jgi:hypothetical protein
MMSMSRRLLMVALAVSVAGATAACGTASPTATPTASSLVTTSAASTSGNVDQFCTVVRQQKTLLQGTQLSGLLTGGTSDAWKAYLEQTATMNQQLVDTAPPEVKASVKTLQDGTLALKSAMEAANYDVSKIGSVKLIQLLQTPERKAATTSLVTYVQANCGLDLTKVG